MIKKILIEEIFKSLHNEKILSNDVYLKKFMDYFSELKKWNENFNLTGLKSDMEILIKLFLDSLYFIKTNIVSQCETILDVGTGAGFPGIPNAIYFTDKSFFLIESNKKKCSFLEHIKYKLNLENIIIINKRAELLAKEQDYREKFDCALIKAFNPFNIAMEISIPFIKLNGFCAFYASNKQKEEIINNKKINEILGFKIFDIYDYELPDNYGLRSLIIVQKMWKTSDKYPRKYKNIKLKPLELIG